MRWKSVKIVIIKSKTIRAAISQQHTQQKKSETYQWLKAK